MKSDEVLKLMKERRSVRTFKEESVPNSLIDIILEAGRWCQSSANRQPWRFIVIRKKELIEELSKTATYGSFVKDAPVVIAIVVNKNVSPTFHMHDSSMATHQMCLMVSALGLGTCWIGTMDRNRGAKLLNLNEEEHLTTILPIGVPQSIPNPTPRKKIEELVSYIN
jgi:nitroreductase